jgi:hypothetical protein
MNSELIHELEQPGGQIGTLSCRFPEATAVIKGNNLGRVFVDDPDAPGAALVWAQGIEGFYLVGNANSSEFLNGLDIFTEQVLKPRLFELGITWLEISGDETWNPVIEKVYRKRILKRSLQWVYTLKPIEHDPLELINETRDNRLKRVDRQLLVDRSIGNRQLLISKLTHFWSSADAFLNTGLGYVMIVEEEIASLCFSGFVAGNIHAIDIETEPSQRRKGYAERAARAFLAECIEKRLKPHWDCMAENTASSRLAEKLGLTRSDEYTLYSISLQ